jgi:hypothetical protein
MPAFGAAQQRDQILWNGFIHGTILARKSVGNNLKKG